jgi:hypothetical protein
LPSPAGLFVRDSERPPHDHRFVVSDLEDARECSVEVFADGGRLKRRVILDIGPVLHPDDLAADKTLALWGRARPRDFVDVPLCSIGTAEIACLNWRPRRTLGSA